MSSSEKSNTGGLKEYVSSLFVGEAVPQPAKEDWTAAVERLSVTGRINAISQEMYAEFLEVLPLKCVREFFIAVAEDEEPLRIFIRQQTRYLVRQLTNEESDKLYELSGHRKQLGRWTCRFLTI